MCIGTKDDLGRPTPGRGKLLSEKNEKQNLDIILILFWYFKLKNTSLNQTEPNNDRQI